MYTVDCTAQRHVGETNFSIWRHGVEQATWAVIITNLYTVHAYHASVEEGGGRKGIFCLLLSPTSVHNLRNILKNHPMFTILGTTIASLNPTFLITLAFFNGTIINILTWENSFYL